MLLLAAAIATTPFFPFHVNARSCANPTIREPLASIAAPASRVSCSPCTKNPPIREALAKAGAVFVGKAITGDVEKAQINSDGNKIVQFSGRVRFGVEWVFNGVKRSEVIVIALDDPCFGFGPFFTKGERYLLYAQGSEDQGFYVTHCNRSEPITSAEEDLKILSRLSPKTCGVRLYGWVGLVSGIKVTATDPRGKTLEALSGVGHFEIKGVKANVEYMVQAHLPDYFQRSYTHLRRVRINPCGWEDVRFSADYESYISGLVIGPDGNRVSEAVVELKSSNKIGRWNDKSVTSDSRGRFELRNVAPGAYLLGINITEAPEKSRPYPTTFYPEATSRQAASIIEVKPGQKLSGYDIIISRKLAERTIEGTVFWPDGRPAANADIYLSPSTRPGLGAGKFVYTDDQGRFKVTGYEGIAYYVVAMSAPNRHEPPVWKWFFAEPPLVELKGEDVTGLRMTLTWGEETLKEFFKKQRDRQK
jgi:hypothetical protein